MRPSDVAALVPAAGSGERLGRGPKAFVEVGGRSLLAWAVAALAPRVGEVLVAVGEADVARARAQVPQARVIEGGATRQETVARLAGASRARWVVVHDAARPFLDDGTLRAVLEALPRTRALSVVTAVADSLIDARDGRSVDRSLLRAVQTPQAFERALLLEAHEAARREGREATDDAGLVRALGLEVALVEGGAHLFKVTTPSDLALAQAYAGSLEPAGT